MAVMGRWLQGLRRKGRNQVAGLWRRGAAGGGLAGVPSAEGLMRSADDKP